jgi:protein-S-isoprenylcysteine O-methyltransferase Ste14
MKQSKPFAFDKVLMWVYSILMSLPIILVFIFYSYYGLDLLVYIGWMIFAVGLILIFLAGHEFQKNGGVPKGKHLVHTTVLVDSGIYALVRHPQYLSFILLVLGLILISQHWLSIVSGVAGSLLFYIDVRKEEQSNIKKFGNEYKSYMQKVPGMNLLAGVIRLMRRRKRE